MDGRGQENRKPNPRENANLLSKISFLFTLPTFRQGYRKDFEQDDIYEVVKSCNSTTLGNKLEKEWQKQKRKRNPCFIFAIFRIFGFEYACLGLALLTVNTTLILSKPILIGKLVSYFSPTSPITQVQALGYCLGLIACIFANTTFLHSYMFGIESLSLKVKISCCTLIYRKCLRLTSVAMANVATGQTVTLMTKDVNTFDMTIHFAHQLWIGTIQTTLMTIIMYRQIGVSAFVGISMLILLIPLQVYLGKKTSTYRLKTAERTDHRVRITQEILTAIRIIKMYVWELFFSKEVSTLRKKEIRSLRILFYIKAIGLSIGQLSSRLAFYICVMAYIALGNHITAEKAFVVTGCFGALRSVLTIFMPLGIAQIAELKAAIQRITNFLLLEEVPENQNNVEYIEEKQQPKVCVKKVTVNSDQGNKVLEDISLELKQGLIVLTGPTGSGKSTLLKLLLADVKKTEGVVDIAGKMSYASQEPWLFPGTVKQNIIFGEWFDKERYETIIKVCALKKDLDTFPNGDKTCVTDRGLNLSRGQKARINLARAVYKKADIYLLDDCLSAVDTHVGKQIFHECLKGFLRDTICVLVTHQNQVLKEADNIIILSNGCVKFQGSYFNLKTSDNELLQSGLSNFENEYGILNDKEKEDITNDLDNADEATKLLTTIDKSRNIYEEKKKEGAVNKAVYYTYFTSGGGIKMLLIVIVFSILAQATASWSDYFVSFWVDMEQEMSGFRFNDTTNSTKYKQLEESHDSIMRQYSFVIIAATAFTLLRAFTFFIFSSKASENIHNLVMDKILNAGMMFFDVNLSGNVLNRFSRDLGIIDEQMPYVIFECTRVTLMLIAVLFVVSSVNLFFLVPSAIFTLILFFARRLYLPTGRSIRRLEGATRSPVIGHLNATLEGLTTIRASQAQKILRKEFDRHQDLYNSVTYMHLATTRAFGFYLDMMCAVYIAVITLTFLFFRTETLAGKVGLAITQSFSLTGLLQWGVRQWAELENQMTSAERVLEYTKIESEEKEGDKPNSWPNHGRIVYNNVNLRYSINSERVLKDLSFIIEPQWKVGIVGRTGAGKSSIISVLFRMYEFRGTIRIDSVDINSVSVEMLRSKVSIIPQDPVLFSGSIRNNLDPYGEYADKDIWDALEEVEMKKLIASLNTIISEGGSNFSIGQRQLLCLARAVIRKNVILVLDEATANLDPQTDALIQRTIKRKFSECTVITIAHRLHTIMDSDRILVMDSGSAVEYDDPKILLQNESGMFYNMVKEAGLL